MLLCIDTGNTNTVFSIWDGKAFLGTWRASTEYQRTADQYFVWLNTLMKAQNIHADITEVIISSAVPRVVFNLRILCDHFLISARLWSFTGHGVISILALGNSILMVSGKILS